MMDANLELRGRRALVTGGTKGLRELAPQGLLKAFAWLQTSARHDPKRLTAIRCANPHEENFLRAG